jgi:hypothetical protein
MPITMPVTTIAVVGLMAGLVAIKPAITTSAATIIKWPVK